MFSDPQLYYSSWLSTLSKCHFQQQQQSSKAPLYTTCSAHTQVMGSIVENLAAKETDIELKENKNWT